MKNLKTKETTSFYGSRKVEGLKDLFFSQKLFQLKVIVFGFLISFWVDMIAFFFYDYGFEASCLLSDSSEWICPIYQCQNDNFVTPPILFYFIFSR